MSTSPRSLPVLPEALSSSPSEAPARPVRHGRTAAGTRRQGVTLAWLATLITCAALVAGTDYRVHDADSKLYAAMSADLAAQPFANWGAPEWGGHWQRHGLFFEHPPGLVWLGAALIRLGAPAAQALCWLNFAAFFGSMALLYGIGLALSGPLLGGTAVALWVLCPAFLQYLVRGSQEHPLTFAVMLGLYALVTQMRPLRLAFLWGLACTLGLFIKGMAALALFPIGALYWWFYDRRMPQAAGLLLGSALAGAAAATYETVFQSITGTSFWLHYAQNQVLHSVGGLSGWASKAQNLLYYAVRPLWFFLPGMVLVLRGLLLRWQGDGRLRGRGFSLGVTVAAVFILGFSLANRKAERYLFPMYPALAVSAAWVLLFTGRRGAVWQAWIARRLPALPFALMALILAGVALKIYVGTYHYVFIRWWPGA